MNTPIQLSGFPKNEDKYLRLIGFFCEILDICAAIGVSPIVDGSLAVFAYTSNSSLEINDIDVGFPEAEYPRMIEALKCRGIDYRLMDWHVLRALRDDLRVELGSVEYWYSGLPMDRETLLIGGRIVNILGFTALTELYRLGMEGKSKETHESDGKRAKYEALRTKYEMLLKLKQH